MEQVEDEQALWSASLAGDGRAFARLFALHRDRVFRQAARLLESDADADDIAAAAFFELWRRRGSVRVVEGSVLPWLLVTAANLARNARRGTRRYRAVLDRLPRDHPVGEHHGLALTPAGEALKALSPTDAALLVLTAFEGWSTADAAALIGINESTARSRLFRARKRLRVELARTDPDLQAVEEGS